jgi:hypothetical protein
MNIVKSIEFATVPSAVALGDTKDPYVSRVVKMEAGDFPATTNVMHYVRLMGVIKLQENAMHALHLPKHNTSFGIIKYYFS